MSQKPSYEALEQRVKALEQKYSFGRCVEGGPATQEPMFRNLFMTMAQGVVYQDATGTIIFVNPAAERILGLSVDQMAGRTSKDPEWKAIHEDGTEFSGEHHPAMVALQTGKEIKDVIMGVFNPREKAYRWINVNAVPEFSAGESKPYQVYSTFDDITERKRKADALHLTQSCFDRASYSIFRIGSDAGIRNVNDQACRSLGYTREELCKLKVFDIDPSFPREKWLDHRKKVLAEGAMTIETIHRRKDGSTVPVEVTINYHEFQGQEFSISFVRDITHKKSLEVQLVQSQKMEAIGTLAGGIAHDFNNILMGIQGRVSLMQLDAAPQSQAGEHLQEIAGYVQNASDLTQQLLAFARGGKYETRPTDLNEIIQRSSKMFGRTRKEITIHIKKQENIWGLEVDQSQIEQVMLNLYVNAWQSMPGRGDLYLETENFIIDENFNRPYKIDQGKYVRVSVKDNGIGMDMATQKRIFEPFFTTKKMGRGTGLGLASAYGIIKNHGGIIDVFSEKDQGTTFHIYLPASGEAKMVSGRIDPEMEIVAGKSTILLVDDEKMIVDVAKSMLERLGYRVYTAINGKEALALFEVKKDEIDLVVLDMIMPEMGGGEVFDRLKAIAPDVKVLLSSGYSINGQASEILSRGCNGFIQKPFTLKAMSVALQKILKLP